MALARSPNPGDESRSSHIVSAIEDRNELCTAVSFAMGIADTDVHCVHSHAHPPTLVQKSSRIYRNGRSTLPLVLAR